MEQNHNLKQPPQQTSTQEILSQTSVQSNSSAQKIITQQMPPSGPRLILTKPQQGYFTKLFAGRMNRQNFIVGSSFFGILPLISVGVIFGNSFFNSLSQMSNLGSLSSLSDNEIQMLNGTTPQMSLSSFTATPFDKEWLAIGIVLLIISLPYLLSVQIKRLHDLNLPGWLWILNVGPFFANPFSLDITSLQGITIMIFALVSTVFSFYTTLWPGTNGPNKYGDPPSQDSKFFRDVMGIG